MRILIQTACYCILDGVSETIRKIEVHVLSTSPNSEVCILTTKSGDLNNAGVVFESMAWSMDPSLVEGARRRRRIIYVNALKLPIMEMYEYRIGLRLCGRDLELIQGFRPDVIHTTVPDLLNLDLINYARRSSTPLMSTFHSNYIKYMDYYEANWIKVVLEHWMRHMFSFVPVLYVPTPFYKNLLSKPDYHLDKCTDIKVWSRGVDVDVFRPEARSLEFRKKFGFEKDDVVVAFVGRLVVEKNPQIFVDVMKRLRENGVKCKGLLVGEGPYRDIAEREAGGVITTTGWLKGRELVEAYASSDVFLFPSGCETFGNVTLEACSCGVPIIVEEGCSSHLVDGNGFGVRPDDVNEFYNKTKILVEDEGLRKKMGKRSRNEVAMKYKVEIVMRQIAENYQRAIETQVGKFSSGNPRFPDNEFNFPWGRTEHPAVLRGIEAVFWIVVTSCVKGVQFYTFLKRFVVFQWVSSFVRSVVDTVQGSGFGAKGGQAVVTKCIGEVLAWCILKPLLAKPVVKRADKKLD